MKKALFFDADGTLCHWQKGISPLTIAAIHAVAKEHWAFLCTARPMAFITPDLRALPFHGVIAACGTYIAIHGQVCQNYEIPAPDVWHAMDVLRRHGFVPLLEGTDYLYFDEAEYSIEQDPMLNSALRLMPAHWLPIAGHEQDLHVNKLTARTLGGYEIEPVQTALDPLFNLYVHEDAAGTLQEIELVPKGYTKGTGMRKACQMCGIAIQDTIAFGDSVNDMPLFEAAAYCVAMGHSHGPLKSRANYVTADFDHDGIYWGLRHLGLIKDV